jgi:misacylated tRNA(Ala) deacylase
MTELLYQTDSYLVEFNASITGVDVDDHSVILNQTAFYPGGGGQPYDTGLLKFEDRSVEVIRVKKIGNDVFHYLNSEAPLPKQNSSIVGEIDWDRRFQIMRTHTALHILCGVVFRDYGASVTGGDMKPLSGRMDFEFQTMHKELVEKIEESVNVEVEKARDIKVAILPRDEAFQIPDLIRTKINLLPEGIQEVRIVEIVGLDLQADGGTHVKNTQEVGTIQVIDYKSKGKINKRIYIALNDGG